jgi:PAS domain S-box-containing protein
LTLKGFNSMPSRPACTVSRVSAGQLELLIASVRDYAIFLLAPDGTISTWNAGAEHLKGYTAGEAIGRHFSLFYTDEDRARGHPQEELRIAEADGRFEEEGWRLRKDGTRFWASVVITALRDETGQLLGFGKVTRDLTERRMAEQELQRFTGVAAHDLTEPLRTVIGFAEMLQRRESERLSDEGAHLLSRMVAASRRMRTLIDELLVWARAGETAPPAQPSSLLAAAESALATLQATVQDRGARVALDVPADAVVGSDPSTLSRVLQNLLSNALKFGAADGPSVGISAERRGDVWRTTVSDDGIGIETKYQARIFEAFERLHTRSEYPGTGLGLSIVRRLVERHGGTLGVEAAPGEGSRFWFELPVA